MFNVQCLIVNGWVIHRDGHFQNIDNSQLNIEHSLLVIWPELD